MYVSLVLSLQILMSAEDEVDAQAATEARAEQAAELAEFDEAYAAQNDVRYREGTLWVWC